MIKVGGGTLPNMFESMKYKGYGQVGKERLANANFSVYQRRQSLKPPQLEQE